MTFAQLHEQLRLEILRRIRGEVLTVTLLARQTGLKQPHISNFLQQRRMLSLSAVDKVLESQRLSITDLVPGTSPGKALTRPTGGGPLFVPLVPQTSAIVDKIIGPAAVLEEVWVPPGVLEDARPRCIPARRSWQRFVAVRVTARQAEAMAPLLKVNSIVLIDRHYNSLTRYRQGAANLYAVSYENSLVLRYLSVHGSSLLLSSPAPDQAPQVIDLAPGESAGDYIIGRAFHTIAAI